MGVHLQALITTLFLCSCLANDFVYDQEADMYYKAEYNKLSWVDAKWACASQKASLAMPRNPKEFQAVMRVAASIPEAIRAEDSIWLGFHDIFEEGDYVGLQGDSIQYYYNKWATNQPNNYGTQGTQNCGSLWYSDAGLDDEPCGLKFVSICEKHGNEKKRTSPELSTISDSAYECPDNLDKCFKLNTNARKWSHARAICVAEGGNLAVIQNKDEEDYLVKMMKQTRNVMANGADKRRVLLGFHDMFREGLFTTVYDGKIPYGRFEVAAGDNSKNCGALLDDGTLIDYECDKPARFVCEKKIKNNLNLDIRSPVF